MRVSSCSAIDAEICVELRAQLAGGSRLVGGFADLRREPVLFGLQSLASPPARSGTAHPGAERRRQTTRRSRGVAPNGVRDRDRVEQERYRAWNSAASSFSKKIFCRLRRRLRPSSRAWRSSPRAPERVRLDDAYGRILADNDRRRRGLSERAALGDGRLCDRSAERAPGTFSYRRRDRDGASVGQAPDTPGRRVRIPTGGVVPDGADAVVPIEDVRVHGENVAVEIGLEPGTNVNPAAGDMRRAASSSSRGRGSVVRRWASWRRSASPKCRSIRARASRCSRAATSSSPPGMQPAPGQVRDSNRYAIAGALQGMGAVAVPRPDRFRRTGCARARAAQSALRGGRAPSSPAARRSESSIGRPRRLRRLGPPGVIVHGLRVKPGKPTVLAAVGSKPVIGLPGNPTSALVILEAVVAPIIAALAGAPLPRDALSARRLAPGCGPVAAGRGSCRCASSGAPKDGLPSRSVAIVVASWPGCGYIVAPMKPNGAGRWLHRRARARSAKQRWHECRSAA